MDFLANFDLLLVTFWTFVLVVFLLVFPFFRARSARRLDSRLGGPRVPLGVRRRGRLSSRGFSGDVLRVSEGFQAFGFVDLSVDFSFLRDRSARWLDSRLRGPRFSLFVRRRGRLNPRKFLGDFLLVGGGLLDFALVDFRVLPRPQCQLAGLASPRDLVLVYLSYGEAGVTLVVFLAYSFSGSVGFYEIWRLHLFERRRG